MSSLPPVSVPRATTLSAALDGRDPVVDGADTSNRGHQLSDGSNVRGGSVQGGSSVTVDVNGGDNGRLTTPTLAVLLPRFQTPSSSAKKKPHQNKWYVVNIGYPAGIHDTWGNAQAAAASTNGTLRSFIHFQDARQYYKACYEQGNCWVSAKKLPSTRRRTGHSGHESDPISVASSPIQISSTPVSPAHQRFGAFRPNQPTSPTKNRDAPVSPTTQRSGPAGSAPAKNRDGKLPALITPTNFTNSHLTARTTFLVPGTAARFSDSRAVVPAESHRTGTLVQHTSPPLASTTFAASDNIATRAPEPRTGQKNKKRYVSVSDSSSDDGFAWTRKKDTSAAATHVKKSNSSTATQVTPLAQPAPVVQAGLPPAQPVRPPVQSIAVGASSNATAGSSNHAKAGSSVHPYVIDVSDFEDEPIPRPPPKRRTAKKRRVPKTCVDSDGYQYTEFDAQGWDQVGRILDNALAPEDASRSM
ncbi:hypothetical protein GALMADRAFT_147926 [Galerina marginata CBS 339.88]|uniref:Uncharacterized protein n=1 Tax=Galerina marginata (strain CBS 339.88) TaxID=685588 RepID=A0A067S8S2_GALM3|nr:hypothetical protein GALMADRAFT_147926 [Galerina marginata CBS 339.88]